MTEIVELGYVTIGVADVSAWTTFATEIVGAEIGEKTDRELLLRNDDHAYRIRVLNDKINDVLALGWCVPNQEYLDRFENRVRALGLNPRRGTAEEAAERRVKGFVALSDPDGVPIEVFWGPTIAPERRFNSPLPGAGFLTGTEGMGHVGIWSTDVDRSVAFYRDRLGLRVCDRFDGAGMRGAFLRCNDRQHSLALVQMVGTPPPRKLHHIEFECLDMDDVGRAYDRAGRANILMTTLGKHSAEDALTFYMYTPASFGFELSWGGIKIRDDRTPETWHGAEPLWGLKFIPPIPADTKERGNENVKNPIGSSVLARASRSA